jgi:hypothetical protein
MKEKAIGLIFFSGLIVLHSISLLRHRKTTSKSLLLDDNNNNNGNPGNLIIHGTNEFEKQSWRSFYSSNSALESGESIECQLIVTNDFGEEVLFCWISDDGELRHYCPINDGSIQDGSVHNTHTEYTFVGHSFVCIKQSEILPKNMHEINDDNFLFSYTPNQANLKHKITIQKKKKIDFISFIAFITQQKYYKIGKIDVSLDFEPVESIEDIIYTTDKIYTSIAINGFQVNYEPTIFEETPHFLSIFKNDLEIVNNLLPKNACLKLQETTTFWINKSFCYGTKQNPVELTSCTFHPVGGHEWFFF